MTTTLLTSEWKQTQDRLRLLSKCGLINDIPSTQPEPKAVIARRTCPFHSPSRHTTGNLNPTGFLIFENSYYCTKGCHSDKTWGNNHIGLIRRLANLASGREMPAREAFRYLHANFMAVKALIPPPDASTIHRTTERPHRSNYTLEALLGCLTPSSRHFLDRGFKPETLDAFKVGTAITNLPDDKPLLGWTIFPCFGEDGSLRGYTARNPAKNATDRWFHGVAKSKTLFNINRAVHNHHLPFVITEGPADCMRLHEAGYQRTVALLGSTVSDEQFALIYGAVALTRTVILAADNDEAGRKMAEGLYQKLKGLADVKIIYPPEQFKDFGETSTDLIPRLRA